MSPVRVNDGSSFGKVAALVTNRQPDTVAFEQLFSFTGFAQYFVVPAGITEITVIMAGAQGYQVAPRMGGGYGAVICGPLPVTAGETLQINVGGDGWTGGGWNGGGQHFPNSGNPFFGGGATDIRRDANADATYALSERIMVAGGGGEASKDTSNSPGPGALGGLPNGSGGMTAGGTEPTGAGGQGTTSAGGAAGVGTTTGIAGTLGVGGSGAAAGTGVHAGGGGGYYGGGSGGGNSTGYGAGGAGSSLIPTNGFGISANNQYHGWCWIMWGSQPNLQIFNSSGTWTKPTDRTYNYCRMVLVGGGGSGGKANNVGTTSGDGAGGGGAGGLRDLTVAMSVMNSTQTVTVGLGGASQTASATDGYNGGDTSMTYGSSTLTAGGGKKGTLGDATTVGLGGAGGTGDLTGGAGADALVAGNNGGQIGNYPGGGASGGSHTSSSSVSGVQGADASNGAKSVAGQVVTSGNFFVAGAHLAPPSSLWPQPWPGPPTGGIYSPVVILALIGCIAAGGSSGVDAGGGSVQFQKAGDGGFPGGGGAGSSYRVNSAAKANDSGAGGNGVAIVICW